LSTPTLSICIPTYNFGAFIGQTLASITPQVTPDVEIVILDGGSTDDTQQVVQAAAERSSRIRYVRQTHRGGIDRDMARVVDLAQGEYCWLFSADDVMHSGSLDFVLQAIRSADDLYLCGVSLCDIAMRPIGEHPVSRAAAGEVFELRDDRVRARYFRLAETTTAFFSFMGAMIFKRSRWMAQSLDERYIGSLWAHVVRLLRLIPEGLRLHYIGKPLLAKRSDNDSFMDRGLVHRYALAIDGYHRIAADVFGPASFEARQVRRALANEFPPAVFFHLREQSRKAGRAEELAEIERLVARAYVDPTLRNVLWRADYRFAITPRLRGLRARLHAAIGQ